MTEQTTPPEVTAPPEGTIPPSGGDKLPQQIPYDRFKEVNDAKKAADAKLAEYESAQEKARQAKLEKEGEYKTLIEEQKTKIAELTTKAGEWDTYKSARRQTLIEKIPEEKRKFAESMNLDTLEEFITEFKGKTSITPNKPGGIQNTGEFGGYDTPIAFAEKDPVGYRKWKSNNKGIKIGF